MVQVNYPVISRLVPNYSSFYAFSHKGQVYHTFPGSSFKCCLTFRCYKVEASSLSLLEQVACLGFPFHMDSSPSWVVGVEIPQEDYFPFCIIKGFLNLRPCMDSWAIILRVIHVDYAQVSIFYLYFKLYNVGSIRLVSPLTCSQLLTYYEVDSGCQIYFIYKLESPQAVYSSCILVEGQFLYYKQQSFCWFQCIKDQS